MVNSEWSRPFGKIHESIKLLIMNDKLAQLLEKREKLNAQISKIRAQQASQKRKEDTRRKILLGALAQKMMSTGIWKSEKISHDLE